MGRLGCKIIIIEATAHLNAAMVLQQRVKEVPGVEMPFSTIAEAIECDGNDKIIG